MRDLYTVEDGWVETYSGQKFYFGTPSDEDVHVADIAHSLGKLCRYGGHTRRFYSVAEHCFLLARWAEAQGWSPQRVFEAFMHDSTEGYLVDVPRPIKHQLPQYKTIEDRLFVAIARRFSLASVQADGIHLIDSRILRDERDQAMSRSPNEWGTDALEPLGVRLRFWGPTLAPYRFLREFARLNEARGPMFYDLSDGVEALIPWWAKVALWLRP